MKIKLWFQDWKNQQTNESIYYTSKGVDLSMGALHSGSVFEGEIILDEYDEALLEKALKENISPVFELID